MTWREYICMPERGIGLRNIREWDFRISQFDGKILSQHMSPLMVVKENRPWMNVSK